MPVAACTSPNEMKASSGSACRGSSTPPLAARTITHSASRSAKAPVLSTASSSVPPRSFHLTINLSSTFTSRAGGRWGGRSAATLAASSVAACSVAKQAASSAAILAASSAAACSVAKRSTATLAASAAAVCSVAKRAASSAAILAASSAAACSVTKRAAAACFVLDAFRMRLGLRVNP